MQRAQVKVDITSVVSGLHELEKTQLPFAVASTLTAVAQDAQLEVKRRVRQAFTLRNSWTEQGVRIDPADKRGNLNRQISAKVYTDTANRATGAPDYLVRQEEGGEKVPFGGHEYLAVPTRYLRQMAPGIIPQELRPRNLLSLAENGGHYEHRTRRGSVSLRSPRLVRGFEFFTQKIGEGNMAILGRYVTDRDAYPFYLLITEAHIRRSGLEMVKTVERVAGERFQRQWDVAWHRIRLRGIRVA